jgi:hypothetical protein
MEVLVFWFRYCTWSRDVISGCTAVTDGARSSRAAASSIVSFIDWSKLTPPMPRCCPGITVSSVVPSELIRSFTADCAPVPSATTAMTAATPITMPSMVSRERSLLARSAPRATRTISPMSIVLLPRLSTRGY